MRTKRVLVAIVVCLLGFSLWAEDTPAVQLSQVTELGESQDDILLSDVPIAYGDEKFRSRILYRTGGTRSPIGLVLSGGSARAMAHIGVLRYLEEQNIVPDYIISNSMGSIVGLLYSAGMSPDQIEKIVVNLNLEHTVDFTIPLEGGLLKADSLASLAVSLLGQNLRLENLDIPIIVATEDLVTKRQILISEGDFATVLKASFAIPVYFPAVEYQGHLLIDGGISNLAPVDIAYTYSDDVIVSTTFYSKNDLNLRNALTSLNTAFDIQKRRTGIVEMKKHPDLIWIRCQVEQNSFMDFDMVSSIAQKGYEAAKEQGEALKKLPKSLGTESLSGRRSYLSQTMETGLKNYFLFDHVRQTDFTSILGIETNSYAEDGSYLKGTQTLGIDYRIGWGNFTFTALAGTNYYTMNNRNFSMSPAVLLRLNYYAFNHLKVSVLADIDWDTAKALPGIFLRQSAELRYYFFQNHLLFRGLESWEHLTAANAKRTFTSPTMLLNAGIDGTYVDKDSKNSASLSGSLVAVTYQMLSDYKSARQFISVKGDLVMDSLPYDLFLSFKNTARFSLDGKGDVPYFFQDGYRTNSQEILTQGHALGGAETQSAKYLISSRFQFGYRPSWLKPSFGELVILNRNSISAYADLLFVGGAPHISAGAQLDINFSFLGLKDFPFMIYVGYDSASAGAIWGFALSTVLN
jgi:NTE family protein